MSEENAVLGVIDTSETGFLQLNDVAVHVKGARIASVAETESDGDNILQVATKLVVRSKTFAATRLQDKLQHVDHVILAATIPGAEVIELAEQARQGPVFRYWFARRGEWGRHGRSDSHARVLLASFEDANTRQCACATTSAASLAKPFAHDERVRTSRVTLRTQSSS